FSRDWSSDVCSSDLVAQIRSGYDPVQHAVPRKPARRAVYPALQFVHKGLPYRWGILSRRRIVRLRFFTVFRAAAAGGFLQMPPVLCRINGSVRVGKIVAQVKSDNYDIGFEFQRPVPEKMKILGRPIAA